MVRIKHRYLVIKLLCPDDKETWTTLALHDRRITFAPPCPDTITAYTLSRFIRDRVSELFGDYGTGVIASSLSGTYTLLARPLRRSMLSSVVVSDN